MRDEFKEIAHSGGKIVLSIRMDSQGKTSVQMKYTNSKPVPLSVITLWALTEGIVYSASSNFIFGAASPEDDQAIRLGCTMVIVGSDSEGMFGHCCPRCSGYWRSGPWPNVCPYCGLKAPSHQFLSEAQYSYVQHYCNEFNAGIAKNKNTDVVLDLDVIADAAREEGKNPSFYFSEQSQQKKFKCNSCGEVNDILGRLAYCSICGTRNDLSDFEENLIPEIRSRINSGGKPEAAVRDAVAAFDSFVAQYARQLGNGIPMTRRRTDRLKNGPFQNFEEVCKIFDSWLDIDIAKGIKSSDRKFITIKFHRRHVYEHNAGEVDEQYLKSSDDATVKIKQELHETNNEAHELLGFLVKMARNLHSGFHDLYPTLSAPIKAFQEQEERMKLWQEEQSSQKK